MNEIQYKPADSVAATVVAMISATDAIAAAAHGNDDEQSNQNYPEIAVFKDIVKAAHNFAPPFLLGEARRT